MIHQVDEGSLPVHLEVDGRVVPTVHPRLPEGGKARPREVEDVDLRVLWKEGGGGDHLTDPTSITCEDTHTHTRVL